MVYYKDLMLDLETLGTAPNSIITQIGACYFDRFTGEIGDKFFINVDIQSSIDAGFKPSGHTITWWLQQSDKARKSLIDGYKVSIKIAIKDINEFMKDIKNIWCHPSFDIAILNYHLNKLKIEPKYHYRSIRDLRTIDDIIRTFKIDIKHHIDNNIIEHNAINDCIKQIKILVESFKSLKVEILNGK